MSLMLATSAMAVLLAMVTAVVRSENPDAPRRTEQLIALFAATMPFLGMLIGNLRFQRLVYTICGGIIGLVIGVLLTVLVKLPSSNFRQLLIITAIATVGLSAFCLFQRKKPSPGESPFQRTQDAQDAVDVDEDES